MKNNMHSALLALLGFSFFLLGSQATAQPERPKTMKKRIIIETTVDENGNEHTERIEHIMPDNAPSSEPNIMQDLPPDIQQELQKLGIDLNNITSDPNYNGNNRDLKILRWDDTDNSSSPPQHFDMFHMNPHDMGNIEDIIIERQPISRTWLGVQLTDSDTPADGVLIEAITPNSPAEKAGLQKGDLITAFDKQKVTTSDQIVALVNQHQPNDKIAIEIKRNGKKDTIKATLAERQTPEKPTFGRMHPLGNMGSMLPAPPKVILGVHPNNDQPSETQGVTISQVVEDSPAKQAGLQAGDIITQIDNKTINTFDELRQQIAAHQVGDKVNITFTRQGAAQTTQATLAAPKELRKEIRIFSDEPRQKHCMPAPYPNKNIQKQVFIIQKGDGETSPKNADKKQGSTQVVVEDDRSIRLAPNPNDGSFRLQYTTPNTKPVTIIVTDLSGKEVMRRTFNDFKGSLDEQFSIGLTQGSYLLQIEQDGKTTTERFIAK